MEKKNLMVLFGGQSTEHDVSCRSALYILKNADAEEYNIIPVGITKEGRWLLCEGTAAVEAGKWQETGVPAFLSPDAAEKGLFVLRDGTFDKIPIDVAFPVLHGLYGEDGTVQGLFSLAGIPYVGCGVLSSAVSMDKLHTKIIADSIGVRQASYVGIRRAELERMEEVVGKVEEKLPYPVFVKPSCAGSSIGVHRAENREELISALRDAALYDGKILVEETIIGREVECAVMGDETSVKAAGVGEIIAAADFYDFDAKYNNAASVTDTDPRLPEDIRKEIMETACRIFSAVDGYGFSRVDFFYTDKGIVFNEINTIPGFTSISMFPMLWERAGMTPREIVAKLIESAYLRREH